MPTIFLAIYMSSSEPLISIYRRDSTYNFYGNGKWKVEYLHGLYSDSYSIGSNAGEGLSLMQLCHLSLGEGMPFLM